MTPKSLLVAALEQHVVSPMQALGFRWSQASLSFTRSRGDLTDQIRFSHSKWNRGAACSFWSAWAVRSKSFRSWYMNAWAKPPCDDYLVVTNDWLLDRWPRSGNGFCLLEEQNRDVEEMQTLLSAFADVGIPFLLEHSTTEAAVEFWIRRNARMDRAIDLLVMSNQSERARLLRDQSIRKAVEFNGPATMLYVKSMQESTSRYFPGHEL